MAPTCSKYQLVDFILLQDFVFLLQIKHKITEWLVLLLVLTGAISKIRVHWPTTASASVLLLVTGFTKMFFTFLYVSTLNLAN